jgi:hypothetical protein
MFQPVISDEPEMVNGISPEYAKMLREQAAKISASLKDNLAGLHAYVGRPMFEAGEGFDTELAIAELEARLALAAAFDKMITLRLALHARYCEGL